MPFPPHLHILSLRDELCSNNRADPLPDVLPKYIYARVHSHMYTYQFRVGFLMTAIILYILFSNLLSSLHNPTSYLYLLYFPKDLRTITRVPEGGVQSGEGNVGGRVMLTCIDTPALPPASGDLGPGLKLSNYSSYPAGSARLRYEPNKEAVQSSLLPSLPGALRTRIWRPEVGQMVLRAQIPGPCVLPASPAITDILRARPGLLLLCDISLALFSLSRKRSELGLINNFSCSLNNSMVCLFLHS